MLKEFLISVKNPVFFTIIGTVLLSVLTFSQESFTIRIIFGFKLSLFIFIPGIFIFKIVVPEANSLSTTFIGISTGLIASGVGYYILGLLGISFGVSVLLNPLILLGMSLLYKWLQVRYKYN